MLLRFDTVELWTSLFITKTENIKTKNKQTSKHSHTHTVQHNSKLQHHTAMTTVLRPLYRSTYISHHLQLRTGGFCCCRFQGLAIFNAKILIYFSNIRKQFYQTAVGNCYGLKLPNADCSLRKKIYCVICCNFWHAFVPYWHWHWHYESNGYVITSLAGVCSHVAGHSSSLHLRANSASYPLWDGKSEVVAACL